MNSCEIPLQFFLNIKFQSKFQQRQKEKSIKIYWSEAASPPHGLGVNGENVSLLKFIQVFYCANNPCFHSASLLLRFIFQFLKMKALSDIQSMQSNIKGNAEKTKDKALEKLPL